MPSTAVTPRPQGFHHEALLYDGAEEFHEAVSTFVLDAVAAGEPILVVASPEKIARLVPLAADHALVSLVDMTEVGHNHARILPTWRALVDAHPARVVRGVSELITDDRARRDGLADYQHFESLLNLAFADADGFWLRCAYDTGMLRAEVIAEARRSHPYVVDRNGTVRSTTYHGLDGVPAMAETPLPAPSGTPVRHTLRPGRLDRLRGFVRAEATAAGLAPPRVEDLVLAANEVGSNSLMYAGAGADVLMWRTPEDVVCEFRDNGTIGDPLLGRVLPGGGEHDERGMWIVNQLCDFVQVRSSSTGSVVRLRVTR